MDPTIHAPDEAAGRPLTVGDALRIQIAAVAAQQIALDEEEQRQAERRAAWEQREEQTALAWEEKRRELESLYERAQAERAAVAQDRSDCERHIERITGDLSQAQRQILAAEKQVHVERRKVAGIQEKLKQRWHRHWKHKQRQYAQRQLAQTRHAASLDQREQNVRAAETALYARRLCFNGDAELSKLQLNEAWAELRKAQFRWRHRRSMERTALRVRGFQVEAVAQEVSQARARLDHDQRAWQHQRQALELELDGVNTRIQNQRHVINQQKARLRSLDEQILAKEQAPAGLPALETTALATSPLHAKVRQTVAPLCAAEVQRVVDLEQLADALVDQRRQLVETWERVAALHDHWQAEHTQITAELQTQGQQLAEREAALDERMQAALAVEETLRQRHDDLLRTQHEIIAWRTQLRIEENAWQSDRARLIEEFNEKDAAAEKQLHELVELRQRWAKRRKKEIENLQSERSALELFRREFGSLRLELTGRSAALDEEKRQLAEKALVLEQYRTQVLDRAGEDAQAERQLERLRRRWLTQNADAIRQAVGERSALQAELASLEQRHEELARRAADVIDAEAELTAKQTAWEEQQARTERRHIGLEQDLRQAEDRRLIAEEQAIALRDEVERIARALLDQPDPPLLSLDRAA